MLTDAGATADATAEATTGATADATARVDALPGLDLRTDGDALLWLIDLLAADGANASGQRGGERYAVLPSPLKPRYLVPVGHGRATSINLRAGPSGWAGQALRAVVMPAVRLGALHALPNRVIDVPGGDPDHPTLAEHLAVRTGHPHLSLSLSMGPPRPNRKPILQLTTPDGTLVAFAKVSADPHTAALVTNEAATLERLAARSDVGPLTVPSVLDHFHWKGHTVVLTTALPTPRQRRRHDLGLTAEVIRTIASLGPEEQATAAESRWWATVRDRIAATEGDDAPATAIGRAADAWRGRWGTTRLEFGHWHGDLTPWNAAWRHDRLLVWDWERSGGPVPLGLDAVHDAFQPSLLVHGAGVGEALAHARSSQRPLLGQLGLGAAAVDAVGAAYLIELALRLAEDARFGSLGRHTDLLAEVIRTAETAACAR